MQRADGAGEESVHHQPIPQSVWWHYNYPRILLQVPTDAQLRRPLMLGWESWEELRADVSVPSRMLEQVHSEIHLRLRQLEGDIAILRPTENRCPCHSDAVAPYRI